MPHLVILYTAQLDVELDPARDMTALCRHLADTMQAAIDEAGAAVFPTGGIRVFAYPAPHSAVADGQRDYAFVYLNLRMGRGRSAATKTRVGEALLGAAKAHFGTLFDTRPLGLTLQIDEGAEVYDGKHGSIHPLFAKGP